MRHGTVPCRFHRLGENDTVSCRAFFFGYVDLTVSCIYLFLTCLYLSFSDWNHHESEDFIFEMIRNENLQRGERYLPGEDDAGEHDHHQDADVEDDVISSFLNPSGEGHDLENEGDEGQGNPEDDEAQNNDQTLTTTSEVYILSRLIMTLDTLIDMYI